jgi:hypothetical protein
MDNVLRIGQPPGAGFSAPVNGKSAGGTSALAPLPLPVTPENGMRFKRPLNIETGNSGV